MLNNNGRFIITLIIILAAKYLFVVVIAISLIIGLRGNPTQRKQYLYSLVVSGVIALASMKLLGHFISDPRPFVVGHFTPLIPHAADNGFPSDHAAISALFAFAVWPFAQRWSLVLLVLATCVGAARVAAGIHHPLDIAGAMTIVLVATIAGHYILHMVQDRQKIIISPRHIDDHS